MTDLTAVDGRGARFLIVDDDPRISALLVTTLRFAGFTTAVAATGADALRQLAVTSVLRLKFVRYTG
jgi:two-component system OmpR family response regulator